MSRVGENIKRMRNEAGMSQKQLAKKLGVAESFIYDVELGRKVLTEALINKISQVLGKQINDIGMSIEVESSEEIHQAATAYKKEQRLRQPEPVKEVWSNAFGSVLKEVPVYGYDFSKKSSVRMMPVQSNKIEGYPQDKVFFLTIEDDDLIGLRIAKGDTAFAHITSEAENNSICLIDYNGERVIRQIKKLDANKALLISNKGSLRTETINLKDIKVIARLNRLEIKL